MDIRFKVEPGQSRLTRDALEGVQNDILRLVKERLGGGDVSWLEAGGYVKWSKGSALLEPETTERELIRLENLGDFSRLIER